MAISTDALQAAVQLARSGQQDAALALLDALATEPPTNEIDLLRAKILAQQKDFDAALALWRRVVERDPDNAEARRGIETAERLRRRPGMLVFWRLKAAVAVLVLGLVAGGFAAWRRAPEGATDPSLDAIHQAEEIRKLRLELDKAAARRAEAESESSTPPDLDLEMPGTTVRETRGRLEVVFQEGLFDRDASLLPGSEELLAQLAQRLAVQRERICVLVIGHTNDLPVRPGSVYRDNEALGLARAVEVIERLRSAAQLPAQSLRATTRGVSGAPFPNESPVDQRRNRTVTILVGRREE